MLDPILDAFDVTIEHRTCGADAEPVRSAMNRDPVLGGQLLVGDRHAHALPEDFRAAAGKRIEPSVPQGCEYFLDRKLIDARDVRDLHCGKCLDVYVRESRLQPAKHLAVVGEPRFHVEATDDMKF